MDFKLPSSLKENLSLYIEEYNIQLGLLSLVAALLLYWIKVAVANLIERLLFKFKEESFTLLLLKTDYILSKIKELHVQMEELEERARSAANNQEEIIQEIKDIQRYVKDLQNAISRSKSSPNKGPGCFAGPPPPPPPPPTGLLITPVMKRLDVEIKSTATSKKKAVDGPPQPTFSQSEIANMLMNLKKTSYKAKLLSSDHPKNKKTPPRRKLFGRSSSGRSRSSALCSTPNRKSRTIVTSPHSPAADIEER